MRMRSMFSDINSVCYDTISTLGQDRRKTNCYYFSHRLCLEMSYRTDKDEKKKCDDILASST